MEAERVRDEAAVINSAGLPSNNTVNPTRTNGAFVLAESRGRVTVGVSPLRVMYL